MKAICSRKDWEQIERFSILIEDLLTHEEVQQLHHYSQHLNTSRFQHSLNVAYYTFLICEKFNWKTEEATRAALLHDLFFYDWREHTHDGWHPKVHPQIALQNAQSICFITPLMADTIVKHMWPMTIYFPKYKEGWVVTLTDKFCAVCEMIQASYRKMKTIKAYLVIALCLL